MTKKTELSALKERYFIVLNLGINEEEFKIYEPSVSQITDIDDVIGIDNLENMNKVKDICNFVYIIGCGTKEFKDKFKTLRDFTDYMKPSDIKVIGDAIPKLMAGFIVDSEENSESADKFQSQ